MFVGLCGTIITNLSLKKRYPNSYAKGLRPGLNVGVGQDLVFDYIYVSYYITYIMILPKSLSG